MLAVVFAETFSLNTRTFKAPMTAVFWRCFGGGLVRRLHVQKVRVHQAQNSVECGQEATGRAVSGLWPVHRLGRMLRTFAPSLQQENQLRSAATQEVAVYDQGGAAKDSTRRTSVLMVSPPTRT